MSKKPKRRFTDQSLALTYLSGRTEHYVHPEHMQSQPDLITLNTHLAL